MLKKYGYTLAEVLIVLALLGIIASILLPAVAGVRPNRDKSMFRKAYHVAERIVYELVNDDDLYSTAEGTKLGLDNTNSVSYNGETFGSNDITTDAAKQKFCLLFSKKVNIVENTARCTGKTPKGIVAATKGQYDVTETSFITTDGVAWYLPVTNFESTDGKPVTVSMYVDVNGEKEPNCTYNDSDTKSCRKPDIYKIFLQSDGKMYVNGTKEKEYLQGNTSMR